jgi:hypothetical protein
MKLEVTSILSHLGFENVLLEHRHCDVVCSWPLGNHVHCTEIERSEKNVLRNLSRNFSQGCATCLIVCPDFESVQKVARKVAHSLSAEFQDRTAIATIAALRQLSRR